MTASKIDRRTALVDQGADQLGCQTYHVADSGDRGDVGRASCHRYRSGVRSCPGLYSCGTRGFGR